MKKLISLFIVSLSLGSQAQIFKDKSGSSSISFHSKAPMEDIEALNKGKSDVFLKLPSGEIQMVVSMLGFKFKNGLMEEHFNENYVETEKFPNAVFKGKINEAIDYSKDGEYPVSVTGKMQIHGETKDVTINGTLQRKGNEIKVDSKFKIKVADYKIKVPSMYVSNIAEEVDVTFSSVLEPYQKK
jgi:hypothetical protein